MDNLNFCSSGFLIKESDCLLGFPNDKNTEAMSAVSAEVFDALKESSINDLHKKVIHSAPASTQMVQCIDFDKEKLLEQLRPGDVLFKYHPQNSDGIEFFNLVDGLIRGAQFITKKYTKTSTSFSKNIVHASIYAGDGTISEAVAQGVLLSSLDDERILLKPGMTCGYIVVRPLNSDFGESAGKIARDLTSLPEGSLHKYSVAKGLHSLVSSSSFDQHALKRYLKGAAYAHGAAAPLSSKGYRKFYCSYFVAWCWQTAESKKVLEEVNQHLREDERITFPNLNDLDPSVAGRRLHRWAAQMESKHSSLLKEHIRLTLDAKRATPQRLYGFVLEHPEMFEHVLVIKPPTS